MDNYGFDFRDLADVTADGRLDRREFAIACHLISSQVEKDHFCFSKIDRTIFSINLGSKESSITSYTPT